MRPSSRLMGLVFVLTLTPAAHVLAYVIAEDGADHPLWWPSERMPIGYGMVANNVPEGAAGENAVHRAFQTWSNASANLEYRFEGFADSGQLGNDGRNLVVWFHTGWPYDPTFAAMTYRFYDSRNGQVLDADIAVNGEGFHWSAGDSGHDIENALTHEVGHIGGLDHTSDGSATMFGSTEPLETQKRSLEPDDLAGLDAIYGGVAGFVQTAVRAVPASVAGASEGGGGGCAVAPMGSMNHAKEWWALLALLAALRLGTQRSRSRRLV